MKKVRVSHFYKEHMPGAVVEVDDDEADRIVAGRGGTIVDDAAKSRRKKEESAEEEAGETEDPDRPDEAPVTDGGKTPKKSRRKN